MWHLFKDIPVQGKHQNTPGCHRFEHWQLLIHFLCEHWMHSKHKEAQFTHLSRPNDHEDVR